MPLTSSDSSKTHAELMGKLDSKVALIAGGTGGVSAGIVRVFLKEGA
jgi:hypothetical protein